MSILSIKSLNIYVKEKGKSIHIVKDLNLELNQGEITGLVGESGSGKSLTALAIMNLMPNKNFYVTGDIIFEGIYLNKLSQKERRSYLGNDISMIFQDPMISLNPLMEIGKQIGEPLRIHFPHMSKKDVYKKVIETMIMAELPNPEKTYKMYPHQLSGGLRQRVMIATALVCSPKLLIADEPTTALDAVIQKEILMELEEISSKLNLAILFISHDLGVVKNICNNITVMYSGEILEEGKCKTVLENPQNQYTKALLESIPTPEQKGSSLKAIEGFVPEAGYIFYGCPFASRCKSAIDICFSQKPKLVTLSDEHSYICHISQRRAEENE